MNGVFIEEGQQVGLINPTSGLEQLDFLEDERQFAAPEVEAKVTSPDSNQKIVAELKKYADEHEQRYGRFPKTLIFGETAAPHREGDVRRRARTVRRIHTGRRYRQVRD